MLRSRARFLSRRGNDVFVWAYDMTMPRASVGCASLHLLYLSTALSGRRQRARPLPFSLLALEVHETYGWRKPSLFANPRQSAWTPTRRTRTRMAS